MLPISLFKSKNKLVHKKEAVENASANTTVSIARSSTENAKLIDGAIGKYTLRKMTGIGLFSGLRDCMVTEEDLILYLIKPPVAKLNKLPCGKTSLRRSKLFIGTKLRNLFVQSRASSNRSVVVDMPSPSMALDRTVSAIQLHGVYQMVRLGNPSENECFDVIEQI